MSHSSSSPSAAGVATGAPSAGGAVESPEALERSLKSSVSQWECVKALFSCYSVAHQFDRYYKDGRLDDCARHREELSLCLRLPLADAEESRSILRGLLRSGAAPTDGVVWEIRKDAGGNAGGARATVAAAAAAAARPAAAAPAAARPSQPLT